MTDPCPICERSGHLRWTTLSCQPSTIAALGLPKPDARVELRVCHGCYLRAVALILERSGLPRPTVAQQLLPFGAPKEAKL